MRAPITLYKYKSPETVEAVVRSFNDYYYGRGFTLQKSISLAISSASKLGLDMTRMTDTEFEQSSAPAPQENRIDLGKETVVVPKEIVKQPVQPSLFPDEDLK